MIMVVGSIAKKLVLGEFKDVLHSKEIRWKDFESTKEALFVCERSKERKKYGEGKIKILWEI
jgi:hypothetical protein